MEPSLIVPRVNALRGFVDTRNEGIAETVALG
jgi:hypothetical protein